MPLQIAERERGFVCGLGLCVFNGHLTMAFCVTSSVALRMAMAMPARVYAKLVHIKRTMPKLQTTNMAPYGGITPGLPARSPGQVQVPLLRGDISVVSSKP